MGYWIAIFWRRPLARGMKRDPKPSTLPSVVPAWARESLTTLHPPREEPCPASSPVEFRISGTTFLRVHEAAAVLQVSTKTVRRLIARGDLKAVRIGRSVRIHSSELEHLIAGSEASAGPSGDGGGYV